VKQDSPFCPGIAATPDGKQVWFTPGSRRRHRRGAGRGGPASVALIRGMPSVARRPAVHIPRSNTLALGGQQAFGSLQISCIPYLNASMKNATLVRQHGE